MNVINIFAKIRAYWTDNVKIPLNVSLMKVKIIKYKKQKKI